MHTKSQFGEADGDVAGRGPIKDDAAQLLDASVTKGTGTLSRLAKGAMGRLLKLPPAERTAALKSGKLFSDAERQELAGALAATAGTAELLGRAGVRQEATKHAEQGAEQFAEWLEGRAAEWVGGDEPAGEDADYQRYLKLAEEALS